MVFHKLIEGISKNLNLTFSSSWIKIFLIFLNKHLLEVIPKQRVQTHLNQVQYLIIKSVKHHKI